VIVLPAASNEAAILQETMRAAAATRRSTERKETQQALLAKQQQDAYERQEAEAEREAERLVKIEEKRQKLAEDAAAAREKAQRRIAMTMQMKDERNDQMRTNYVKKLQNEETRRLEFQATQAKAIEERRRAAEEKQMHMKKVQEVMELQVEARKNEIIGKEREHLQNKERADADRQRMLAITAAEKEMRMYKRQTIVSRNARRAEYRRDALAAKTTVESQRIDDLLTRKAEKQRETRERHAKSTRDRQAAAEKLEGMRGGSSLEVDDTTRSYIKDPHLKELLERCDEKGGESPPGSSGTKVSLYVVRDVLKEMQSEGKFGALSGSRDHGAASDGDLGRPKSTGALK